MKKFTANANITEIENITADIDEALGELNCPMRTQLQIDVAIDEILSNIAKYGYEDTDGKVEITLDALAGGTGVIINFTDDGKPYNPLEREDPDVTLSAEDRQIGGLGIYIVKKTMDSVEYECREGRNVLTITKNFNI